MLNIKQINQNITNIRKAGVLMDQRIHETGVSIIAHAAQHGDFTSMQRLYEALPRSVRKQSFVKWVVDHTPLNFDEKLAKFLKTKSKTRTYDVEKANATPFWDYTVEVAKTLDVDKLLQFSALVEQAESRVAKAIENGAEVKGDVKAFNQRAKSLKKFKVAA